MNYIKSGNGKCSNASTNSQLHLAPLLNLALSGFRRSQEVQVTVGVDECRVECSFMQFRKISSWRATAAGSLRRIDNPSTSAPSPLSALRFVVRNCSTRAHQIFIQPVHD